MNGTKDSVIALAFAAPRCAVIEKERDPKLLLIKL
jgi:hypothetical protein